MATLRVRDVINGLCRKGFQPSNSHHKYLIFYFNGKKTVVFTKVSHGGNQIGDDLIDKMSIQVKLEKNQFVDLVNCPLSYEQYVNELRQQGVSLE
ncbi:MAG: hypothetical protein QCH99_03600 [Candidatus Bathyarchaeota archaeon]|nr:hypothetical protein [Candidatus Bathyarchaeum tardum]WGM88546.1 MAG: hypothetical protein NUK63_06375 [Candidatus Bathyarchaeum tardum]